MVVDTMAEDMVVTAADTVAATTIAIEVGITAVIHKATVLATAVEVTTGLDTAPPDYVASDIDILTEEHIPHLLTPVIHPTTATHAQL